MKNLSVENMAVIVFASQILFLYFRTVNVKAVSNSNTFKAIWTGWGIAITWMIGISIGATSMMEGHFLPIISHLLGGTLGTYLGMKK